MYKEAPYFKHQLIDTKENTTQKKNKHLIIHAMHQEKSIGYIKLILVDKNTAWIKEINCYNSSMAKNLISETSKCAYELNCEGIYAEQNNLLESNGFIPCFNNYKHDLKLIYFALTPDFTVTKTRHLISHFREPQLI